jgi:hypothetical protein
VSALRVRVLVPRRCYPFAPRRVRLMPMDQQTLDALLGPLGLLAFLLVAVVWGGRKGWWVFGWVYEQKVKESDEWKSLALSGTRAAESGVRTIEKLAHKTTEEIAGEG